MKRWKKFEEKSTNYLNKLFEDYSLINFKSTGKSDSTASDIMVYHNDKNIFNIEAKLSPSQSGQFVVLYNKRKFEISEDNTYENPYNKDILNMINDNIHEINLDALNYNIENRNNILTKWIKSHYLNKHSKYIITSTKLNSFYAIVQINNIEDYFNISAVLRAKRSGTRTLPKTNRNNVINKLKTHISILKSNIISIDKNKRTYIYLDEKIAKNNLYFGIKDEIIEVQPYYLSYKGIESKKHKYEIRKRSSTKNPNIIFSLEYTGPKINWGHNNLQMLINSY